MAKECPKCRLLNPPEAQRCDCGYDFESGRVEQSYITAKPKREGAWGWMWPSVADLESAMLASRRGFWAAGACAVMTGLLALLALAGVEAVRARGFDASALGDGAIFAAIAFGLWRYSRIAAWAGLLIYLFERVVMWSDTGLANPAVAVILTLAFAAGIRGTHAVHRLRNATAPAPNGAL